jgi:hypothetical protein
MRYRIIQHGERRYLMVQGSWDPRLREVMDDHHLTELHFQDFSRQGPVRIDFLRELPLLERLSLWAFGVRDVSPLYDPPKLRELALSECRCTIDFPRMPSLRELRLGWSARKFASLLDCTRLQSLGLDSYTGSDFLAFAKLESLENVGFGFARLERLAGLGAFGRLRRLSLGPVNRLESLEGMEDCRALTELEIEAAKNLRSIDPVRRSPSLRILSLIRCPNIATIEPITAHPSLERVGIGQTSNVRDGDLSPLETLPRLGVAAFMDRKHYNRKNAEFPKMPPTFGHRLVTLFDSEKSSAPREPESGARRGAETMANRTRSK